jgi:hypothetical protein
VAFEVWAGVHIWVVAVKCHSLSHHSIPFEPSPVWPTIHAGTNTVSTQKYVPPRSPSHPAHPTTKIVVMGNSGQPRPSPFLHVVLTPQRRRENVPSPPVHPEPVRPRQHHQHNRRTLCHEESLREWPARAFAALGHCWPGTVSVHGSSFCFLAFFFALRME